MEGVLGQTKNRYINRRTNPTGEKEEGMLIPPMKVLDWTDKDEYGRLYGEDL